MGVDWPIANARSSSHTPVQRAALNQTGGAATVFGVRYRLQNGSAHSSGVQCEADGGAAGLRDRGDRSAPRPSQLQEACASGVCLHRLCGHDDPGVGVVAGRRRRTALAWRRAALVASALTVLVLRASLRDGRPELLALAGLRTASALAVSIASAVRAKSLLREPLPHCAHAALLQTMAVLAQVLPGRWHGPVSAGRAFNTSPVGAGRS